MKKLYLLLLLVFAAASCTNFKEPEEPGSNPDPDPVPVIPEDPKAVITFKDSKVKSICTNSWWDTDRDGELSYEEAAVVTSLDARFGEDKEITSFDELQYFTGLTMIHYSAFSGCTSLSSVVIPENVTELCDDAFRNCSSLESIRIPEAVSTIGTRVFSDCPRLERFSGKFATSDGRFLVVGDRLAAVAPYGLSDCSIPEGVDKIGESVFSYCTELESVSIPSSVKVIAAESFLKCEKLSLPIIPSSVTVIGDSAFGGCKNLGLVHCYPTTPPDGGSGMFDGTNDCPIYVPASSINAYKYAEYWRNYADRIRPISTSSSNSQGDGTLSSPYNAQGVIDYINSNDYDASADVYVKGRICSIKEYFNNAYGDATFNISDDGSTSSTQFTCFRIYYLEHYWWYDYFSQIEIGDDVIVYGKVVYYEPLSQYETLTKNAYLYSLNGNTKAEI